MTHNQFDWVKSTSELLNEYISHYVKHDDVLDNIYNDPVLLIGDISKKEKKEPNIMEKRKISDFYKYKSLSNYSGLGGKILVRADTTFVGVEVEVEHVKTKYPYSVSSFSLAEDGSLKEDGREYVTIPIQAKYLEIELQRLFDSFINYKFTSRCSIHIHLNSRDFTLVELKVFLALYMIFEKSLFNFSGHRNKSNYCVPLYAASNFAKDFIQGLNQDYIHECWYKYFAFNLCPLFGGESKKTGTIEFRHMEGTDDIKRIIDWINLIISLKITAKKISWKEMEEHLLTMNTTSGYYWLAKETFKDWEELIVRQPTFKSDVESGITAAKWVFINDIPTEEII